MCDFGLTFKMVTAPPHVFEEVSATTTFARPWEEEVLLTTSPAKGSGEQPSLSNSVASRSNLVVVVISPHGAPDHVGVTWVTWGLRSWQNSVPHQYYRQKPALQN